MRTIVYWGLDWGTLSVPISPKPYSKFRVQGSGLGLNCQLET